MFARTLGFVAALAVGLSLTAAAQAAPDKQGTTYRSPNGTTLHLMLDDSNVGPEVSVGEITFPPNVDSGDHVHGSIEILYVLSGQLEHFVNGKSQILTPGMTGYVKAPDKIRHKTGAAGAKVLVIWVPGDEAKEHRRRAGRKSRSEVRPSSASSLKLTKKSRRNSAQNAKRSSRLVTPLTSAGRTGSSRVATYTRYASRAELTCRHAPFRGHGSVILQHSC